MYGEACYDSDEEEDVDEEGGEGGVLSWAVLSSDVYLVPCQDCMPDIPGSRAVNMTLLLMSLADETLDNSSPFFQGHTA